ncbi:MAG: hypothetical protein L0099_07035 [Acidobacteria bacterium]|nr:hypothetical protein [Acidobacteriota bacterium]
MLAYLYLLVAVAIRFLVALRLLPFSFNFTPVGAALLFFGARAERKRTWIPVLALAASDVALNRFVYGYPFTADLLVTWAWYAGIVLMGGWLKDNERPLRVGGAALATSVTFFLVSNFAVWAVWNMYPKTAAGLLQSYVAGLPFFRQTVASDLLFSVLFFGLPVMVGAAQRRLRAASTSSRAA